MRSRREFQFQTVQKNRVGADDEGEMRRLSGWVINLVVASLGAGCAGTTTVAGGPTRELVMAYDDARPSGAVAFPADTYESVVRFQLPDGEHQPLRLRFQAESAGSLEINIYGSTLLETPGEAIRTLKRELSKDDLSDGKDGRWVVEDLVDLKPLKGIVWVGVHKVGGSPSIWASSVVSGQAFVRNNDPTNPMGLLPDQAHADDPPRARALGSREGETASPARAHRGRVWEPSQGSHRWSSSPTVTGAAMSPASQAPASPMASGRLRPAPSFTAIAEASAQPVPRGLGPGVRGRLKRSVPDAVTRTSTTVPVGGPRCPPLIKTARNCSASISHRPVASASSAVASGRSVSAAASMQLGVTSVARRSSGRSSRGSAVHRAPPREVASTGSTTTGPGVVAERLEQRGGGCRVDGHPDLHRRRPERRQRLGQGGPDGVGRPGLHPMQARALLGPGGFHGMRPGAQRGHGRHVAEEAGAAARIDAPHHDDDRRVAARRVAASGVDRRRVYLR